MILAVVALLGFLILYSIGLYVVIKYVDRNRPVRTKPHLTPLQARRLLMKRKP